MLARQVKRWDPPLILSGRDRLVGGRTVTGKLFEIRGQGEGFSWREESRGEEVKQNFKPQTLPGKKGVNGVEGGKSRRGDF